jgi:tripartite-type tricarboxylate transporter receptor subunit TctC
MTQTRRHLLGMTAASIFALATSVQAQSAEEFYDGKTINMTVAAATGGMADTVARAFAQIFAKHIPGEPSIVVQNMPGAGGLVGGAYLAGAAKNDGTEIAFLLGNVITTPLVTGNNQFDPREVEWIGAINSGDYPYAAYAYEGSPVQTAEEIFSKEMVIGSTSFTNYNRVFPAMMNEYAGAKFQIVAGYKGSGEVELAMERGEADGWFTGSQHIRELVGNAGAMIEAGTLKPIMLMASEHDPRHPDLPVAMDFIKDPEQQKVAQFLLDSSSVGRPVAAPKGTPAELVEALQQAMADTFADPEFAAFIETSGLGEAKLQSADELHSLIDGFYATPEVILDKVRVFTTKK